MSRRVAAWRALGRPVVAGGVPAALVLALYGFGTLDLPLGASATSPDSPLTEPPVVGIEMVLYPAAFIAIFVLVRRWTGRAPIWPVEQSA